MIVQIDVEELSGLPGLGHAVHEVQAGHLFVSDFGIDADHFGMIERGNESKIMTGGGHVNIAARFVGLGFQGETILIPAGNVVFAKVVDGLAQALDGFIGAAASIGLDAFAASP